jgi:hypothetical protein
MAEQQLRAVRDCCIKKRFSIDTDELHRLRFNSLETELR